MRERAVFIGSISVWDTIGTLPPSGIEIVTLFRPVYCCCVMGRKAPRKRLAYRVISAFTRVFDAHDTPHGCSAEHPNVSRRSADVSPKGDEFARYFRPLRLLSWVFSRFAT